VGFSHKNKSLASLRKRTRSQHTPAIISKSMGLKTTEFASESYGGTVRTQVWGRTSEHAFLTGF
jgi:hypothetical protein